MEARERQSVSSAVVKDIQEIIGSVRVFIVTMDVLTVVEVEKMEKAGLNITVLG